MNLVDYADWHTAYVYLNQHLFDGTLPEVTFTLVHKSHSLGYAAMNRFVDRKGQTSHELAMNPDHFLTRPDLNVLSTLAHEQCHIWQFCFGKPAKKRYHNKEWGNKMEAIGLIPSDTGEPGGKRTGDKMSHYIVPHGPFEFAAAELLIEGWQIQRGSLQAPTKKKDPSKVKFTCPCCGQNAWAKQGALLLCGECDSDPIMEAAA